MALAARTSGAEEVCRYGGTTSYNGQVSVETRASTANGETTIGVTTRLSAKSFGLIEWRYWLEEISVWRNGEMRSIGINHRYVFGGRIQRQQWDVFTAEPGGMSASRVQAKSLGDFQDKHHGFVSHWDLASFGMPWLADYRAAAPERRTDLDLPRAAMPARIGPPLALAFYWVRWQANDGQTVPIFLPGFKHDPRANATMMAIGVETGGVQHLRATIRHPSLSADKPSAGDAWVTADHRLARVTLDAHDARGNATGDVRLEECRGDTGGGQ